MSILKAAATAKVARVGVALGLAAGALVAGATTSSAATTGTIAPATGPASSTTTVLAVTGTGFKSATGSTLVTQAQFNIATTCPTTKPATAANSVVAVSTLSVISATRIVLTTPSLIDTVTSGVHSKKDWMLCLYTAGNALNASAKYTVYPAPTVTSLDVTSGPVLGGNAITVAGTGFTSKTTATIGGTALSNIKVATDGASFTATVPAHAAGTNVPVLVTTEGGTSADTVADDYDFLNAITVSPQTGINATATPITVKGVGFSSMDFVTANKAKVYLSDGAYDPTDNSGAKTNAEVGTCGSVQVISDTELVCVTPASISDRALTVTVVNDSTVDAQAGLTYLQSVVSSSATFTFAAF